MGVVLWDHCFRIQVSELGFWISAWSMWASKDLGSELVSVGVLQLRSFSRVSL